MISFPINLDLKNDEPMVEIITSQFNIDKYPTVIINNKKYAGVVKKKQMEGIICESLKSAEECK